MIGDVCTRPAVTVSREATIHEAAHRMRMRKVGALVAVDAAERPLGILTDRDIAVKIVAEGRDPAKVLVGSVIRRNPAVIREDQGILEATKLLSRRGVRRLPVIARTGKLVGVVSLDDLLMLLGSEMGHIASALAGELGRAKP
jgi:signal-transduction protein with cAMP-binding, CBS, and nucleotidyltransferase domain